MVKRKTPLEDNDAIDIFEHEVLHGVHVDMDGEALLTSDATQTVLGGLISAEEHSEVHDLD